MKRLFETFLILIDIGLGYILSFWLRGRQFNRLLHLRLSRCQILLFGLFLPVVACAQGMEVITLAHVLDTLVPDSRTAKIEQLKYRNALLRYMNYRKSFLPSLSVDFTPVNFNRSLRLLQQASDGNKMLYE